MPKPDESNSKNLQIKVVKKDGRVEQFDQKKLTRSITSAGATQQQANLVTNRVIRRLIPKMRVTSKELSSMTARSLSRINTTASQQYTAHRNKKQQKTRSTHQLNDTMDSPQLTTFVPPQTSTEATIQKSQKTTINLRKPDLVIEEAFVSDSSVPNPDGLLDKSLLHLHVKILNRGTAEAVFEMNMHRPEAVHPIINWQIPEKTSSLHREYKIKEYDGLGPHHLAVGESISIEAGLFSAADFNPKTGFAGTYTVNVIIDPDNCIEELNKNNNENTFTFTVKELPASETAKYAPTPRADLIIAGLNVTTTPDSTDESILEVTVKNIGPEPAEYDAWKRFGSIDRNPDHVVKITGISTVPVTSEWNIPDNLYTKETMQLIFRTYFDTQPRTYVLKIESNPKANASYHGKITRPSEDSKHMIWENNYDNNLTEYNVVIGDNRKVEMVFRKINKYTEKMSTSNIHTPTKTIPKSLQTAQSKVVKKEEH